MEEKNDIKELDSVSGTVEDIIFQSDETGYTVCEVDTDGEPCTLVGTMPSLMLGDSVRAMGKWVSHPTYGKQFKVSYFEKSMPVTANAMLRYLSSRAVKGIGPKLALRIVERFGDESFSVIENNPEFLSEIKGITVKKAREMSEDFKAQFGVRNIMMFFGEYFGMTTSVRIYKRWGNAAVDIVKRNPYILCDEIYGIGFERADAMASSLGIARDSEERVRAGIKYVLRFNSSANGHCYLPRNKLTDAASELLSVEKGTVDTVIGYMKEEASLIVNSSGMREAVYLPELFRAEANAASRLSELARVNLYGSVEGTEELIRKLEISENIKYAPMQLRAIRGAIENPVTVLTGGPGTGKTTIIKAIVNIFGCVGMKISLAAPTGRAAKRMTQSTGYDAKTIHRLLEMEFSPDSEPKFVRDKNNPLDSNVIIIDEMSMVDINLFCALVSAIRPGTRVVLIGDADQLPSVGAGDVLRDIIESGCFPVYCLNEIFRQSGKSDIVLNAHRINRGEYPVRSGKDGDFFIMTRKSGESAAECIVDLCAKRLAATYGEDTKEKVQVVSCTRKGVLGTAELNRRLQAALNPPSHGKKERRSKEAVFREGDKVMQIRNNYDAEWEDTENPGNTGFGVFNGDIGKIVSIDTEEDTVTVNFDSRVVKYTSDRLEELEHAFAVTVHKSQGSEYPIVIIPVLNVPYMLSTRNLLYTAVTRAKNMAVLVGDEDTVRKMVDNDRIAERYTGLSEAFCKNQ